MSNRLAVIPLDAELNFGSSIFSLSLQLTDNLRIVKSRNRTHQRFKAGRGHAIIGLKMDVKRFLTISLKSRIGTEGRLQNPDLLCESCYFVRSPILLQTAKNNAAAVP